MAQYDQGGGCACGLMKVCNCISNSQADGSKARPEPKPDCFGQMLVDYWKDESLSGK